jgi:hydroxymethylglutaryl-CoA reductase
MSSSRFPRFHLLSIQEQRQKLAEFAQLSAQEVSLIQTLNTDDTQSIHATIENAVGLHSLPLGVAPNFLIDGQDHIVPMVTEEPSVIAAASNGARRLRVEPGGIVTKCGRSIMLGQIQILQVPNREQAQIDVMQNADQLINTANQALPGLQRRGGGALELHVRIIQNEKLLQKCGPIFLVEFEVDVCDAMGANAVNTMAESLAAPLEKITAGQVRLRILSNYCAKRLATATVSIPLDVLAHESITGLEIAKRIEEASLFAEIDPHRAVTHNKGIMNGIDAVLIATGQDVRAVEAAAHAFAARNGQYTALATWSLQNNLLLGQLTLPMPVGVVGGATAVHKGVQVALKILKKPSAQMLSQIIAAVGLTQNFSALYALVTDGIQKGHMKMHARTVAMASGANAQSATDVAKKLVAGGDISSDAAQRIINDE